MRAAEHNAALNGVKIEGHVGPFFADVAGTFDVIIANLPNEIVVPQYLAKLPPEEAGSIDGGPAGNAAILGLLDAALPHMRRQGSGLLLQIGSIAGRLALPFQGLYAATKFALEALTEAERRVDERSDGV